MPADAAAAIDALNRRFLTDYPREAARHLEELSTAKATEVLAQQPVHVIAPVWQHLAQDTEERLLAALSDKLRALLLAELDPSPCAALLNRLDPDTRARYLASLNPEIARELSELMRFPPDSAGQLMDPRVMAFQGDMRAREALTRLRRSKSRALREIYVTDADGRLSGRVEMQDLALSEPGQTLADISRRLVAAVESLTPREQVVELLEQYKLPVLPVVDISGRLVGVIHQAGLLTEFIVVEHAVGKRLVVLLKTGRIEQTQLFGHILDESIGFGHGHRRLGWVDIDGCAIESEIRGDFL